jgi:hypothetical protein
MEAPLAPQLKVAVHYGERPLLRKRWFTGTMQEECWITTLVMWVYNNVFVTRMKTQTGLLSMYDKVQHASPELTMQ